MAQNNRVIGMRLDSFSGWIVYGKHRPCLAPIRIQLSSTVPIVIGQFIRQHRGAGSEEAPWSETVRDTLFPVYQPAGEQITVEVINALPHRL